MPRFVGYLSKRCYLAQCFGTLRIYALGYNLRPVSDEPGSSLVFFDPDG